MEVVVVAADGPPVHNVVADVLVLEGGWPHAAEVQGEGVTGADVEVGTLHLNHRVLPDGEFAGTSEKFCMTEWKHGL